MLKKFLGFFKKKSDCYQALIQKEIRDFWTHENLKGLTHLTHFKAISRDIQASLFAPLEDFFARESKKLRPLLGGLFLEAFGKKSSPFEKYFILPEILHSASLIIDDIEDGATKRRGAPALHVSWGVDMAVNAANALYFLPFSVVQKSDLSKAHKDNLSEILFNALHKIHCGQGLDILWHKKSSFIPTPEEYLCMVKLKTSAFFGSESRLAILFSGVDKTTAKECIFFAENLGIAFQIMDDVLDLTLKRKEAEKFGKDFCHDIEEGKKTLIVIYACQKANGQDRKSLLEILKTNTRDQRLHKKAIRILEKYGAIQKAQDFARDLIKKNKNKFLKRLENSKAKEYLSYFCNFIIERRF